MAPQYLKPNNNNQSLVVVLENQQRHLMYNSNVSCAVLDLWKNKAVAWENFLMLFLKLTWRAPVSSKSFIKEIRCFKRHLF